LALFVEVGEHAQLQSGSSAARNASIGAVTTHQRARPIWLRLLMQGESSFATE
jgi:hypothetical protein